MLINLKDLARKFLGDEYVNSPAHEDAGRELKRRLVEQNARKRLFRDLKMQYFKEAKVLVEQGEPFHHLLRKSNEMQLREYEASGFITHVQISTGCCQACEEMKGRVYELEKAFAEQPLPHSSCTQFTHLEEYVQGWCRCRYIMADQNRK